MSVLELDVLRKERARLQAQVDAGANTSRATYDEAVAALAAVERALFLRERSLFDCPSCGRVHGEPGCD